MDATAINPSRSVIDPASSTSSAAAALGGDDFFQLLITQLTNQDPLEPTSNEELLNQISSIRDIELSTGLSKSLTQLTEQQRFASASGLVGKFVSGRVNDASGATAPVQGTITAVRFDANGAAVLELEDGQTLSLDQVSSVMDGMSAGRALIGQFVGGVDYRNPLEPRALEGMVTSSRLSEDGRVVLELDTGEDLMLADVTFIDPRGGAQA